MIDRELSRRRELRVSNHYKGTAGTRYVHMRQQDQHHIGYTLDFEYFKPFLKSTIAFWILVVAMVAYCGW